jgi:hypothetical protein
MKPLHRLSTTPGGVKVTVIYQDGRSSVRLNVKNIKAYIAGIENLDQVHHVISGSKTVWKKGEGFI